jgi:hypothetical protein
MEPLGRLAELAACQEASSGAHGQASAVIITGPPGIGETSLWRAADMAAAGWPRWRPGGPGLARHSQGPGDS